MSGNVADLAATGQTRTPEQEEEFRLDCLARYWVGRPRDRAQGWLNKQAPEFRENMRQRMNRELQAKRERRS